MASIPASMRLSVEDAARIYNQALAEGKPGTREVMVQGGIGYATALRKIQVAKYAGLIELGSAQLEAAKTGRNAKALAVAQELGVEYDALLAALGKHAQGRLVVTMAKCEAAASDDA